MMVHTASLSVWSWSLNSYHLYVCIVTVINELTPSEKVKTFHIHIHARNTCDNCFGGHSQENINYSIPPRMLIWYMEYYYTYVL